MFWGLGILLLTLFVPLGWQDEVKEMDVQIEQLKDLQNKYRSSVEKNVNNAMRWQFQNQNYLDARRAWDKAAEGRQKIQELQDQIDDLESRKQQLLEKHKN